LEILFNFRGGHIFSLPALTNLVEFQLPLMRLLVATDL
jgi:hypothetical protein